MQTSGDGRGRHVEGETRFMVEIGASTIDGRGLFARERIPRRAKIGHLGGELVSVRTARRRARQLERIAIVELGDGTAIDATAGEDAFKYINHSCRPNAYMRVAHGRVEFYALRAIAAGEELTCDYGETHHDGTLACRCGAEGCRGLL